MNAKVMLGLNPDNLNNILNKFLCGFTNKSPREQLTTRSGFLGKRIQIIREKEFIKKQMQPPPPSFLK